MVYRIPDAIMFCYYLILYVKPCSQTKIRVKPGHLHCTTNKKKIRLRSLTKVDQNE